MRILYIACGNGCDKTIGGSLIRTVEIARRLQKKCDVFILTSSGGKVAIQKLLPKKSIFEIKTNLAEFEKDRFFFAKLMLSYALILIKSPFSIKKIPAVDIVYLDSDGIWDIFPAIFYKRMHPHSKIVSMNHHLNTLKIDTLLHFFASLANTILQKIGHICISICSDAVFILDTSMGDRLKHMYEMYGYKKPLFYVKNGVDLKLIQSLPYQNKRYDACFFGYLRPGKGLSDIVPIWRNVVNVKPDARLIIIGGMLPQYKNQLTNEIKQYDLSDNIVFTNYIEDKKNALIKLKQSKIFISPSHEEGWGIAIIESLASGLPGVVWDLKTYDRIIKTGIKRARCYDINSFSQAIIELLQSYNKTTDVEPLQTFVRQYDWDNIAKQDFNYFKKIISA